MLTIISDAIAAIIILGPIAVLLFYLVRWAKRNGHTGTMLTIIVLGPTLSLGYLAVRAVGHFRRQA